MSDIKERATIRQVDSLLREVLIVEDGCESARPSKRPILTDFQQDKVDLNNLMKTVRKDIQIYTDLIARQGKSGEAIELKYNIENDLTRANQLYNKMTEAHDNDMKNYELQKTNGLSQIELETNEELLNLFKQDLKYTEKTLKEEIRPYNGFQIARQARERRRKQRENLSESDYPLTQNQQDFIQKSIERDAELDIKLIYTVNAVRNLGEIARSINEELEKQGHMIFEIGGIMDNLEEKLETRNSQLKKLLETSGGARRWCPILVLCVLLLALCGYIYSSF